MNDRGGRIARGARVGTRWRRFTALLLGFSGLVLETLLFRCGLLAIFRFLEQRVFHSLALGLELQPLLLRLEGFDFGFATALSFKDVRLCLEEAEAMGVPMIMGAVVRQILAVTQAKYGPDSDFTSIAKLSEEWAGVQIRG